MRTRMPLHLIPRHSVLLRFHGVLRCSFHYACSRGWVDLAEHLLVCGADPSSTDAKGQTGMDIAVSAQRQDVEQRLRDLVAGDGQHRSLRGAVEQARYGMVHLHNELVHLLVSLRSLQCCVWSSYMPAYAYSKQATTWSRITPKGQGSTLANFTNDPSFLDPGKYKATFAVEATEFVREGRGGYADPGFRFPGPRGGAAQWQRRGPDGGS